MLTVDSTDVIYIGSYTITVLSIVPITALGVTVLIEKINLGPILSVIFGGIIMLYSIVEQLIKFVNKSE